MPAKLLIVEDDELLFRMYLDAFKNDRRFFVNFVRDGLEAVDKLKAGTVDVIVTDLCMPRMDGVALLRHLRAEGVKTPVLVVTGFPDTMGPDLRRELGVAELLLKPVDLAHLKERILAAVPSAA